MTMSSLEVIRWVQDHGGIEEIEKMWDERARLWSALSDIVLVCGMDGSGGESTPEEIGAAIASALKRRLMPEGLEWPVDRDGVPIVPGETRFGQSDGREWRIDAVGKNAAWANIGYKAWKRGEDPVRLRPYWLSKQRPALEVLDADGMEIRVGDTVWNARGTEFEVMALSGDGKTVHVKWDSGCDAKTGACQAKTLTHRAPVLAADGKPLREGETVYLLPGDWCDRFPLLHCYAGCEMLVLATHGVDHVRGGVIKCRNVDCDGICATCYPQPSQLTHERPDSWKRLEDDATLPPYAYAEKHPGWIEDYSFTEFMAKDLVRRAKKLAGVE